jgi:hypothetical protein
MAAGTKDDMLENSKEDFNGQLSIVCKDCREGKGEGSVRQNSGFSSLGVPVLKGRSHSICTCKK